MLIKSSQTLGVEEIEPENGVRRFKRGGKDSLHLFIEWTEEEQEEVGPLLKEVLRLQLLSLSQSSGAVPLLAGEINPGDELIWEPNNPSARCEVTVTRVSRGQERIWTTDGKSGEVWNDESRIREACIRKP